MSLTKSQWFGIANIILSACMVSTTYFTDTFGAGTAHIIVGTAAFLNMIVGGVATIITGTAQQVRDVAALPGVERVSVNAGAAPALASVATDPDQPKVGPISPEVRTVLVNTAKGA